MVRYPDLIQRPLVEQGEKAVLARPAEKVSDFL
jgi:arsenate reductase-like glutaredoxin family protein